MKKFFYACAGLFMLTLAITLGCTDSGAGNGEIGRYQVISGSTSFVTFVLVDTVTGDTWQSVAGSEWFPMEKAEESE